MIIDDTIVNYLYYPQPDLATIKFLERNFNSLTKQTYAQAIYMNPANFKVRGKFVLRKFKPEYKLMTKIIPYNIATTRS